MLVYLIKPHWLSVCELRIVHPRSNPWPHSPKTLASAPSCFRVLSSWLPILLSLIAIHRAGLFLGLILFSRFV